MLSRTLLLACLGALAITPALAEPSAQVVPPSPRKLRGPATAARNASAPVEVPAWCVDIPEQYRTAACRGSESGCACQSWCAEQVPSPTWKWNPECCGCAGAGAETQPQLLAAVAEPNHTGMTAPAWCGDIPEQNRAAACRGSQSGCACQSWCAEQVPSPTWKWNPECCGCAGAGAETKPQLLAAVAEPNRTGMTAPAWCTDIPEQYRAAACRGSESGCACKTWCAEQVPSSTWKWNPECCACAGAAAEAQPQLLTAVAAPGHTAMSVPVWCADVPEQYRAAACRGSQHGCACKDWCEQVPSFTWKFNPECCACDGGAAETRPQRTAGAAEANHTGMTVPAWCADIPEQYRAAACRGSQRGCACQDWCTEQVPSFTWKWNPECCACAGAATETTPQHQSDVGEPIQVGMKAPAWCADVPEQYRATACRGSESGCTCKSYCSEQVPSSTWKWNPECCACTGTGVAAESGAGRPALGWFATVALFGLALAEA